MTLASPFSRRIAGIFATRVARFVLSLVISFLLARLLSPEGRGTYAPIILVPTMLFTLGQLGLPSAITFFAGRGRSGSALFRTSLGLAAGISLVLLAIAWPAAAFVAPAVVPVAPPELIQVALLSLPFQFAAAFCGSVLIGRQTMRNYNVILVAQSAVLLILIVVLLGALDLGVRGAVTANVLAAAVAGTLVVLELRRTTRDDAPQPAARLGELTGYGMRIYPASITGFFSYRADIFLLSAMLGGIVGLQEARVQIGLYALAVSLAELAFYVPDSVATVFFPRVAGAERRAADEMTPQVSRFTLLLTALAVLGLVPAAGLAVWILLPDFLGSLPPFLLLLPGVVSLSVAKVVSSYLTGLGLPLRVAAVSSAGVGLNVVANLLLIPAFGIMGAAAASLISYSAYAAALVAMSARVSGRPALGYVVPTRADGQRLVTGVRQLAGTLRRRTAGSGDAA
ncbi:MAG TPA: polysaccharide biosynthesis C-terminal domain-containing protein [Candidatus Limnocylindria bacterium]|nr:polysaccharide biosynthesis C-terminal domain-containing protein [Candidatus Limnocylindria bacterium]